MRILDCSIPDIKLRHIPSLMDFHERLRLKGRFLRTGWHQKPGENRFYRQYLNPINLFQVSISIYNISTSELEDF